MAKIIKIFLLLLSMIILSTSADNGNVDPFFRKDYTFLQDLNAFYKAHKVQQNFTEAIATCSAEGAQLLVPESLKESQAVIELHGSDTTLRWIGIHDMFGEAAFVTIDGANADDIYMNWESGEPNNVDGNENCVVMTRNATYNDVDCKHRFKFVCKRSAVGLKRNERCETYDEKYEFFEVTDNCYKIHELPRNWRDAYRICRAEESDLVIINSEAEDRFLVSMFARYPQDSLKGNFDKGLVFIGFNDLINEGVHLTVKGQPISETGFERWGNGQPDNYQGVEHCGSIFRDGSLNDVNCENKAMFICEKKLTNSIFNIDIRAPRPS